MTPCVEKLQPWWEWHPPVGTFIAILAFLGVFVPLYREWATIKPLEKAAWTFLMFALLGLELRTLSLDRKEHDEQQSFNRCQDQQRFQATADRLGTAITQAQVQYSSTIDHVNRVLAETQSVARTAKQNLENVTGGDSFAYVYLEMVVGENSFMLKIHNEGRQILSGVNVTMYRVVEGSFTPGVHKPVFTADRTVIGVGTLSPGEGRTIADVMQLRLRPDGTASYHLWINAQNPGVEENIEFKPATSGRGFAYKLEVTRKLAGEGDPKTDGFDGKSWFRNLKKTDWIEP